MITMKIKLAFVAIALVLAACGSQPTSIYTDTNMKQPLAQPNTLK